LQEAAKKAKEAIQEAIQVEEVEDNKLSKLSNNKILDKDINIEIGDI